MNVFCADYPRWIKGIRDGVLGATMVLVLGRAGWSGLNGDRMRLLAQQRYGAAAAEAVEVWRGSMASWRDLPEEDQLRRVNEFFNRRVRFVDDVEAWGQADYWATPLEVLARGVGDCEDFVIAKYFSLRDLGVSDARLRLTYVKARVGGPGSSVFLAHMVLSYYPTPDSVPLILDNLIRDIRPASSRPDLAPVYSFNSQGIFVGTANQVASPVDRVSRWPELLVRMRAEGYEP